MASSCPRCKSTGLEPTRIEQDLPALGCEACGGSLLSLVSYRHWRERQPAAVIGDPPTAALAEVSDTSIALCCPKCERFMSKFRVSADARNQVDLCVHCDEVWLDRGEWQLIDQLALAGKLTLVFTQPWQQRVRSTEAERRAEQRWHERLGEDFDRAREIREWLRENPNARDVFAYLQQVLEELPR